LLEKINIVKQIVEDERLLTNKGIQSAIDPDARASKYKAKTARTGRNKNPALTFYLQNLFLCQMSLYVTTV
jgi:hypothetical protein